MNEIERHIQQTTDRLQCIKQHLISVNSFRTAARELLEWCMDERAFQPHFEAGLISCLTVVSKVAPQAGYDFDLGYRLLAACATHKEKLSQNSAGLLTSWCEELGQLLMQRQHQQQQTRTCPSAAAAAAEIKTENDVEGASNTQKVLSVGAGDNSSQSQSLEGHGEITTWGPSSSSSASSSSQMSSPLEPVSWDTAPDGHVMPFDQGAACFPASSPSFNGKTQPLPSQQQQQPQQQQQQQQSGPVTHHGFPKSPYGSNSVAGFSGQNPNGFIQQNGYPPTPTTPGSGKSMYEATPMAVEPLASSVVSPASSGTAAAAAMMSPKAWPRQESTRANAAAFGNCRPPHPPPPQMYPGADVFESPFYGHSYGSYDAAYIQSQPMLGRMHGQPHPHPHPHPPGEYGYGHAVMPPVHSGVSRPPKDYALMPLRAAGMYAGRQQVAPYPCNPQQYMRTKRMQCPLGQQTMYGSFRAQMGQPCYGPRLGPMQGQPHHMGPGVNYLSNPTMRPGDPYGCNPVSYPPYPSSNGGSVYNGLEAKNTQSQQYYIPGNPTPPVTPGSSIPTYLSPASDVKPNISELKQQQQQPLLSAVRADELRLTFPVHDGILMAPFRLEHNLAVSNHVFHLNESVYQALMSRSDFELHLKCFHHEDCQMTTNWPASVMVSVNATPMTIEVQRPLDVKDVCHLGRNTIQITVTACCCSHMFIVHLVHRPTVKSVICGLLEKNLVCAEQCLTKLKPFLCQTSTSAGSSSTSATAQQPSSTKISLRCPLTLQRIGLPVKGQQCCHLQWFDLETYLRLNSERCVWKCPICKKPASLEELEVNQLIWAVLESLRNTDCEEIMIDSSGTWRPLPMPAQITSDNNNETINSKSNRGTTISSMTLPTSETWTESYSSQSGSAVAVSSSSLMMPRADSSKDSWKAIGTSDILTSLAQMGESLVDSRMQSNLPSRLTTSADSLAVSRQTAAAAAAAATSGTTATSCASNSALTSVSSLETAAAETHHPVKSKDTTLPPADTPTAVADKDGRNVELHLKETSSSSGSSSCGSSCSGSSSCSSSSSSVVDTNFKLTPICDSEQQDSGLDLLTDGFEDPTELLTYLGPTATSSEFGMGDDLLSLFLPD